MATEASPDRVPLEWPRGSDIVVRGTLGSSVSGHTYAFYVVELGSETALITKTPSVITEATGVMDATLLAADHDTELVITKNYDWEWWRTDSGNKRRVGWGPVIVTKGKPS